MTDESQQRLAQAAGNATGTDTWKQRDLANVSYARDLYWQNVIREMLTSLSIEWIRFQQARSHYAAQLRAAQKGLPAGSLPPGIVGPTPAAPEATAPEADSGTIDIPPGFPPPPEPPPFFDGRLAVLTHAGERIAIAEVYPMIACAHGSDTKQRSLSLAVEATVFQIRTPQGEVFTLPLQEIRGFHSLTDELMKQLEEAAREQGDHGPNQTSQNGQPFGFAAYTSLSRNQQQTGDAETISGPYIDL